MMILQKKFWLDIMVPALGATLQMTLITTVISAILGTLVAVLMIVTNKGGMLQNRFVYGTLGFIVNAIRSFPFLILIVFIIPFTKMIVGTSVGVKGAIVPLVIAATAFIAKIIENALQEVDPSLIQSMKSFGLTDTQVIFKVMFSEAMPAIVSGIILAAVSILNCTAMAGTVGAGGVGAIAILYGYQSFREDVMYVTVLILILMVQGIQMLGDYVYRKMK